MHAPSRCGCSNARQCQLLVKIYGEDILEGETKRHSNKLLLELILMHLLLYVEYDTISLAACIGIRTAL